MSDLPLGWRPPKDRTHEQTYSMSKLAAPATPTPVIIGVPWYTAFDRPEKDADGIYWIGRGNLGTVRGGHAICLRPTDLTDPAMAWQHFNQGREGACVGFATSRAATLFNKRLYYGYPLYKAAQQRDPWPGDNYSGTSVNAGLQTLRLNGAWRTETKSFLKDGIISYGWADNTDQITQALHTTHPFVRVLNSWGTAYPREVRMPLEVLARLLREEGEAGVPLDRPGQSTIRKENAHD